MLIFNLMLLAPFNSKADSLSATLNTATKGYEASEATVNIYLPSSKNVPQTLFGSNPTADEVQTEGNFKINIKGNK